MEAMMTGEAREAGSMGEAVFEPTGDERVDAAVARLAELPGTPLPQHVEIFEDVHLRLQDTLGSADQEDSGPPVPGPRP
jgi:hypothetical protein